MPNIDWLTIRTAASAGLMVVVPAALLGEFLLGDGGHVGWSVLFLFAILLGFFIAGFGAGRLRDDTPLMHGSVAAMVCYVVVQAFGALKRVASGDSINLLAYPVVLMIAATCGIAGAMFADWSARKQARMQR